MAMRTDGDAISSQETDAMGTSPAAFCASFAEGESGKPPCTPSSLAREGPLCNAPASTLDKNSATLSLAASTTSAVRKPSPLDVSLGSPTSGQGQTDFGLSTAHPLEANGGKASSLASEDTFSHTTSLQTQLFTLLARQTASYTRGDSSSVPMEIAEGLLRSLCYTLGISLEGSTSVAAPPLESESLDSLFRKRLQALEKSMRRAKAMWHTACSTVPPFANQSLLDTLRGIASFWKRYDFHFFAHEIPCDIDYPLASPVPDALLGVDFLLEYLRRLQLENDFLRRFDAGLCTSLLHHYTPEYQDLHINLYEPIATAAIGRALLGLRCQPLNIPTARQVELTHLLTPLPKAETLRALSHAADAVCEELSLTAPVHQQYLLQHATGLYPRLAAQLANRQVDGVFLSF